jgi:hypothetical protein
MIGVALCLGTHTGLQRACDELAALSIPLVTVDEANDAVDFEAICGQLHLPPDRIWFASSAAVEIERARAAGFHVVQIENSLDEILDAIGEPYTRSLLGLRHIMRSALEWRAGHVIQPEDVEEL